MGWTTGIESINFPWASREKGGGIGSVEEKYHISARMGWVEGGRRVEADLKTSIFTTPTPTPKSRLLFDVLSLLSSISFYVHIVCMYSFRERKLRRNESWIILTKMFDATYNIFPAL